MYKYVCISKSVWFFIASQCFGHLFIFHFVLFLNQRIFFEMLTWRQCEQNASLGEYTHSEESRLNDTDDDDEKKKQTNIEIAKT